MSPPHPRLDELRAWLGSSSLPGALQEARQLRWRLLPGAAVNLRARVSGTTTTGEQHWFVRFASSGNTALGAHLAAEALAHTAAAAAGLAPALIHADATQGILVTAWWPGQAWRWRQARRGVAAFAELAARLHAVPLPAGLPALDPVTATRHLLAELPPAEGSGNTLHRTACRAMQRAVDEAKPTATRPALIHSDTHAGNILQAADGTLQLVDFEYAGAGAPVHDLAVFATSHDLATPQRQALLEAYAAAGGGTITLDELIRACRVADALWLAWTARVHGTGWLEVPRAKRVALRLAALS